ncbi:hypothetical protein PENSPDRAFT_633989 [Peniophora sp. CONT]|nr:hypothetical protein PENSPDRAFT_633989 [Peniophora sp. CONT]
MTGARLYDSKPRAKFGAGNAAMSKDVAQERDALLRAKQTELDQLLSRHDDLVREEFHLDRFVTLVSYNHQEAKADTSEVWQKWKQEKKRDLLQDAPGGRTTRRARQEVAATLQSPANAKGAHVGSSSSPAPNGSSNNRIWDVLSGGKPIKKGYGRPTPSRVTEPAVASISAPLPLKGGEKGKSRVAVPTTPTPGRPRGRPRKLVRTATDMEPNVDESASPRKRRKTDMGLAVAHTEIIDMPFTPTPSAPVARRKSHGQYSLGTQPPSPVKRIRLIVRTPEPYYSSPTQKPPPQAYGGSLSAALESLNSERLGGTAPDLDAEVRADAEVLERVAALRRRGRMLLSAEEAEALATGEDVARDVEQHDPRTIWDYVVEDVRLWHESHDLDTDTQTAAAVASKVRGYWEAHAAKEDKARLAEEKRLRGLAKATMKLVIGEWKKAVYHLREQDRVEREEEEKRLGREHLDAILDQSGQILESQQLDLARTAGSRSKSTTASLADEDEDDSDDVGTVLDDDEELQTEEAQMDEEDVDEAMGLATDDSVRESSIREGSIRDDMSWIADDDRGAGEEEDADDEETYALLGGRRAIRRPSTSSDLPIVDFMSPSSELISTPSAEDELFSRAEPSFVASPIMYSSGLASGQDHDRHPVARALDRIDGFEAPDFPKSVDEDVTLTASNASHAPRRPTTPVLVASPVSLHGQVLDATTAPANGDTDMSMARVPSIVGSTLPASEHDILAPASPALIDGDDDEQVDEEMDSRIPRYLKPFAVAPVDWDPDARVMPPSLLRGVLRPYQHAGLEWLASLHTSNLNGILADEMGLGKTIQTISLLAHLAIDRGIWGPHLIIVPTSVLLNWEMEFKKFLPGFRVLAYHGTTKRRKELRLGWNDKYRFNVCVTSYTLASRDAHIFKRKPWYYMILDEAHMIKNFRSQRWNVLLMFRSFRRLLLTGTPLQNNLTELWALLQFLMSGTNFANLKEFGEWFANPLEKAIEEGKHHDDETIQRVTKLHTVLRPYLLRRLKRDVEKELPSKYEHLVFCSLSKRQRFLYDEFMSRAQTQTDLSSGVYQKIANVLMQLRKVCNHPDLFEVRPVVTSFAVTRAAVADFEIKELLVRRTLLQGDAAVLVNLPLLGLNFSASYNTSMHAAAARRRLDGTNLLPFSAELEAPPTYDVRTVEGFKRYRKYQQRAASVARWTHIAYLNRLRCAGEPIISSELLATIQRMTEPILPASAVDLRFGYLSRVLAVNRAVKSFEDRAENMAPFVDRFAFATSPVVALGMPHYALAGAEDQIAALSSRPLFDATLHRAAVKLQVEFPDRSLLQYDCGKLQRLAELLKMRKDGGHRVLIFTQMTRILDILEQFLTFHGWLYLRLDGGTKIEDRQYITERFNSDPRIFCFIASSRSGGVGINLTGADTVIFYDSDFNPQMDKQCEDRAHRIGQIRDVHIYRFISQHTVEEAMLRKANQKRSLDDLVIQKGEFDWRSLFGNDVGAAGGDGIVRALEDFADTEDVQAARVAAQEAGELEGADKSDFGEEKKDSADASATPADEVELGAQVDEEGEEGEEEGGSTVDYMLAFIQWDSEHFSEWRL